ncbi:MAG: hypothetical protein QOI66_3739 [Myxococcales bacterium]|nr:hypothetical protein [Myxococcales bacterium]
MPAFNSQAQSQPAPRSIPSSPTLPGQPKSPKAPETREWPTKTAGADERARSVVLEPHWAEAIDAATD